MNQDADCIAVGGIGICTEDISFKKFGVVAFDVLRGNDDLDLCEG
jgi:hypothetical protein